MTFNIIPIRSAVFMYSLVLGCVIVLPAVAQLPSRSPVQVSYRSYVPHTDKNGHPLTEYDPERSFFPIGMWGVPLGYDGSDWQQLKDAGFNTAWTWFDNTSDSLEQGFNSGMQVVLQHASLPSSPGSLQAVPAAWRENLLGIQYLDEPTTSSGTLSHVQAKYDDFVAYRNSIKQSFPDVPVFVLDSYRPPAGFQAIWTSFARTGDLTAQDNYTYDSLTLTTIGKTTTPEGVPEQMSAAADAVNRAKPVWAILGAFDNPAGTNHFLTPTQMRAETYSAIIHGATGIHYSFWDSWHTRAMGFVGIAPNPPLDGYGRRPDELQISPEQAQQSKDLWAGVASTNAEINFLTPALLSPTVAPSDLSYSLQLSNLSAPDSAAFAPNPVRTLLKRDQNGRYILLAVNHDNRSMDVTFSFSKTLDSLELLFEGNQSETAADGRSQFTYHFGAFDTNVFVLTVPEPRRISVVR